MTRDPNSSDDESLGFKIGDTIENSVTGSKWYYQIKGNGWVEIETSVESINTGDLIIRNSSTPSGPTDTGVAGTISYDTGFIYICVDTDTWIRCAKDGTWT
jgi:hypothetical protein